MKDGARAPDESPPRAPAPTERQPPRIENSKTALGHPSNLAPPARPHDQIQQRARRNVEVRER